MTALRFLAFVTNGMQLMHPPGAVVAQRGRSIGDSTRAVRSWLFSNTFRAGEPLVVGGVEGRKTLLVTRKTQVFLLILRDCVPL